MNTQTITDGSSMEKGQIVGVVESSKGNATIPNNFGDLIVYLERIQNLYGHWERSRWEKIKEQLQLLTQKREDKRIYLGIIGEFSSGKSTFINALLGYDILKEDILPGTTCAPTLICYGEQFEVEIHSNSSNDVIRYTKCVGKFDLIKKYFKRMMGIKEILKCQIEEAREFIHKYSAEEDNAKDIAKVIICLPYKHSLLERNIVIVDTPGINADIPRHQEVTKHTIRDICDLVVVLTPAPTPCSQTLISFIHDCLDLFDGNNICIASQIDKIRMKERKRQLKYIADRFQCESITFSQIFAVSAYAVIHDNETLGTEESNQYRLDFSNMLSELIEELGHKRNVILVNKQNQILDYIVQKNIIPLMDNTIQKINNLLQELQQKQMPDVRFFIQEEKSRIMDSCVKQQANKFEIDYIISKAKETFQNRVYSAIENARTKKELKRVVNPKTFKRIAQSIHEELIQAEIERIVNLQTNQAYKCLISFKSLFNNLFRDLANDIVIDKDIFGDCTSISFLMKDKLQLLTKYIKVSGASQKDLIVTAGIIGAIIGLPLISVGGSIWGMLFGFAFGAVFGKSHECLQNNAKNVTSRFIDKWGSTLSDQITTNVIAPNQLSTSNTLSRTIDMFYQKETQIYKIVEREKEELIELQSTIDQALKDYETILFISNNSSCFFQTNNYQP